MIGQVSVVLSRANLDEPWMSRTCFSTEEYCETCRVKLARLGVQSKGAEEMQRDGRLETAQVCGS